MFLSILSYDLASIKFSTLLLYEGAQRVSLSLTKGNNGQSLYIFYLLFYSMLEQLFLSTLLIYGSAFIPLYSITLW